MSSIRRLAGLLLICGLAASACNLPFLVNPTIVPTYVEQTMESLRRQVQTATPTPSLTPTVSPTPTNTPVPVTISLTASVPCYAGPGSRFGRVSTIPAGASLIAVGKDTADNYWIVPLPSDPTTICWLLGASVQASGDTAALPEFPVPTPSMYSLSEPKSLRASCSAQSVGSHAEKWTVVLRWTNTEPNALGIHIYRNGRYVTTIHPGNRSYVDQLRHRSSAGSVSYGVQAYNATAVSGIVTIEVRRCG